MKAALVWGDLGLAVRRVAPGAGRANIESDGLGADLMPVVCAWCSRSLGAKVCRPEEAGQVSHGICPECQERLLAELPGVPHVNNSPAAPGADGGAAGGISGPRCYQVAGPAGSVDAPKVRSQKSDEHAGAAPAPTSANFDGVKPGSAASAAAGRAVTPLPSPRFWSVTGWDFGRSNAWARRWVNPLIAHIRAHAPKGEKQP